eukprot:TRINITY_DN9366_c0_g1_i2.p1 TRINITY_DN9366_c0_g1~~TRINITY_DN9366_c0_g1_i2.p1  ORF type:complete len:634 (+),score=146.74 TRINITY_DN9366_c0_g1_i2:262-2163(+)
MASAVEMKGFDNAEYDAPYGLSKLDIGGRIERNDGNSFSSNPDEDLGVLQERIMKWESDQEGSIWENGNEEALMYLQAVNDLQKMIDDMRDFPEPDIQLLHRMENLLHEAMTRLEEEFRALLEKHSEIVDPDLVFDAAASNTPRLSSGNSEVREDEEGVENVVLAQPVESLDFTMDLISTDVIEQLRAIAARMIQSGYATECCHVYSFVRKMFLEESVCRLGFEKMSIEEVQKIHWNILEVEIAKWMQVVRVSVNVFMTSESKLCERIFADFPVHVEACFGEVAKGTLIQMLSFAEAVAISNRAPEKLFKILDMYETLWALIPKINEIFTGTIGSSVTSEAETVWLQLGEAARGTFLELENAIQGDVGKGPVAGGAIHPLTRYVMNYMRLACDYRNTLEHVFKEDSEDSNYSRSIEPPDNLVLKRSTSKFEASPLSMRTISIMNLLESNLIEKSKLYKDQALGFVFLMNNGRYIVQKVKDEEMHNLLGDDWIRRHSSIVRQYHKSYQRASWVKVLNCLTTDGINVNGHLSGASKAALKEKFKTFNSLVEEIHKTQSSWVVADDQLRAELRISIAEVLIPAYRSFLGRFQHLLDNGRGSEKYIKYETEDLEVLINELFGGTTNSLGRRRPSSSN